MVRISETNAFIREVPYKDQARKHFHVLPDFDKVVNHARYNNYCISLLCCPYPLQVANFLTHFDWFCRYMYFNFEQSILLFEILPYLERMEFQQLGYLESILKQFPQAYLYDLSQADPRQQWALLKRNNFLYNADFLHIIGIDTAQRRLLLARLQSLLQQKVAEPAKETETIFDQKKDLPVARRRERESSLYSYLKLSDDIAPTKAREVVKNLYDLLKGSFRHPYTLEEFAIMFAREDSPPLELIKRPAFDNQHLKLVFQELKNNRILVVSWLVIDRKVWVFNTEGKQFSGFSEISGHSINNRKVQRIRKLLAPLLDMINKHLPATRRK